MQQLQFLPPPKNAKEAIESRRTPCYGFSILADIHDAGKEELISLLVKTRDAMIKIVDPNRTENDHGVHSPEYIKQKFFHAAVFGMQPLLKESEYVQIYANENGLLNRDRINKMCDILCAHLIEKKPYLESVKCELMGDGTILARFVYKTEEELDEAPLLTLTSQLDPEKQFSRWDAGNQQRYNTVAIAICVVNKDNMSKDKLDAIQTQLDLASQVLKDIGVLKLNQFQFVNYYDKRTLSLKHITMCANVEATNICRI